MSGALIPVYVRRLRSVTARRSRRPLLVPEFRTACPKIQHVNKSIGAPADCARVRKASREAHCSLHAGGKVGMAGGQRGGFICAVKGGPLQHGVWTRLTRDRDSGTSVRHAPPNGAQKCHDRHGGNTYSNMALPPSISRDGPGYHRQMPLTQRCRDPAVSRRSQRVYRRRLMVHHEASPADASATRSRNRARALDNRVRTAPSEICSARAASAGVKSSQMQSWSTSLSPSGNCASM